MVSSKKIAVIPAYEPDELLISLLNELKKEKIEAVVVDDGSGLSYFPIFAEAAKYAVLLTHDQNYGKGHAIKTALQYIKKNHSENTAIVTMDADGQHIAAEAAVVMKKAMRNPEALVLGSRKLDKSAPGKSRMGNFITRAVFMKSTGKRVYDTQTGLRAFTYRQLDDMLRIEGERYEYEMNVLLDYAQKDKNIIEVPISAIYLNENSRSHFRAFRDAYLIYKEIIKFSLSSFIGFLVDYGVYSILLMGTAVLNGNQNIMASNIFARIISASVNYSINRKYVFQSEENPFRTAGKYFLLAVFIMGGNTAVLSILTMYLDMNPYIGKLLTELLFFIISWLFQRFFVFAKSRPGKKKLNRKGAI